MITGGRHPAQAGAHHRYLRRPAPPEPLRGVTQGQRRAPEGLQGPPHPLPPQEQVSQGRRGFRSGRQVRQGGRPRSSRPALQQGVPHLQRRPDPGGQGLRLPEREGCFPQAARGPLRGAPCWQAREACEGQGGGGCCFQEIDGSYEVRCFWFNVWRIWRFGLIAFGHRLRLWDMARKARPEYETNCKITTFRRQG